MSPIPQAWDVISISSRRDVEHAPRWLGVGGNDDDDDVDDEQLSVELRVSLVPNPYSLPFGFPFFVFVSLASLYRLSLGVVELLHR